METHTSGAFRIRYRRRGWAASRIKSSDIFYTLRKAINQAHKLNHATQKYMLEPIEELWIERGVIMWSTDDRIEIEGMEFRQRVDGWTPELLGLKADMMRLAPKDPEPTLEQVLRYKAILEEE